MTAWHLKDTTEIAADLTAVATALTAAASAITTAAGDVSAANLTALEQQGRILDTCTRTVAELTYQIRAIRGGFSRVQAHGIENGVAR